jgi:hypothetical protein
MANCFVRVTSQQREQNPNLPALAAKNNGAEFISRNPYPPDGTTAAGASGITAFGDARASAPGARYDGSLDRVCAWNVPVDKARTL